MPYGSALCIGRGVDGGMASVGGRRRGSSGDPKSETEPILEPDRFLLWPRLCVLGALRVDVRGRWPAGLIRSARTCFWKRVLVAAGESTGMSSLTWTV